MIYKTHEHWLWVYSYNQHIHNLGVSNKNLPDKSKEKSCQLWFLFLCEKSSSFFLINSRMQDQLCEPSYTYCGAELLKVEGNLAAQKNSLLEGLLWRALGKATAIFLPLLVQENFIICGIFIILNYLYLKKFLGLITYLDFENVWSSILIQLQMRKNPKKILLNNSMGKSD